MNLLRQSTAFTFRIGPFVDDTDFKTAETALTIAQGDIQISKDGGAFAQTSDASPTTTHDADGWYQCPLTTTDTNTLGPLTVQVVVAGALPVWKDWIVVPANVYDTLVDDTDALPAQVEGMDAGVITAAAIASAAIDADAIATDAITAAKIAADAITSSELADNAITATKIATDAITAAKIAANAITSSELADGTITAAKFGAGAIDATAIASGAIDADAIATGAIDADSLAADAITKVRSVDGTSYTADSGSTTTLVDAALTQADDYWNGDWILFTSGTLAGQVRLITDFVASSDTITFAPATTAAVATHTYEILPAAKISGVTLVDTVTGLAAGAVDAAAIATNAIDADAIADGAIDAGAFAAGAIDATAIATGAIDADAIAAGAIDASAIATDAIDADAIAANAITSSELADGAITAAKFGAGAIDATAVASGAIDADSLAANAITKIRSVDGTSYTADSGSTTTLVDAALTQADDYWNGNWVLFTSGTLAGQVRLITDFVASSDTLTFAPATTAAVSTHTYEILPAAKISGVTLADTLTTNSDKTGYGLAAGAVDATAIASGAIDADAIAVDAIGAAELATDAVNEIRDAILSDSTPFAGANVDAAITTRATPAQVATELVNIGLDHLLSATVAGTDITDDSIIAKLVSASATADWDDFINTTDSLQAIRDRGDAAWITGGGGGLTQILNVQPVLPLSIDVANTATVRLGLILINSLDDLPTTAEITPGTVSIERKAAGGTSWSAVVTDGAMSEQAGMVYYDEVFDAATGYVAGDSIRVTFKSVSITADSNTHEVCDANGLMFQTQIRGGDVNVASISAGAIDAAAIATDAIDADAIAAGAIDASAIASGAIDADALAADTITAAKIAANAITSSELADGAITAGKFASGAIDATAIAANAITSSELADGAITSAKFAAGAIDAAAIASAAITAAKFGAGAIDAAAIAADAIAAAKIAADAITKIRSVNNTSYTADSGTTTTLVDAALTQADADYWTGGWVLFTSGNIAGQVRLITGFNAGTNTITFAPATTQAVATHTYELIPAAKVSGVTLVDTTTTNTDMRGTDSALLASSAPTNFGDLAITVTTGEVTIGTNNDKTGYDLTTDAVDSTSLATTAVNEIRDAILSDSTAFNGADIAAILADTGTDGVVLAGTPAVNATQINANANAAVRLALAAGAMVVGTIDTAIFTPTTTEFEADDITEATADHYKGRIVIFTSGNLAGQASDITDYALAGANGHFTVTALTEAPGNDDAFVIV